jgi:hypothetical protein
LFQGWSVGSEVLLEQVQLILAFKQVHNSSSVWPCSRQ